MKIRVKDIIDFKTDSVKIKPNELLPVLQFLKIEFKENYCTITKNGLNAFIKKNIPAECKQNDGVLLVDENKFFVFAEACNQDFLEISQIGDKIHLVSGKDKGIMHTDDINKFPKNDVLPITWTPIYIEAITAIGSAINFIKDEDLDKVNQAATRIFCDKKSIVSCDGSMAFYKELVNDIPRIIIQKEVATAISNFAGAEFAENNSYLFFKSGSTLYGFSKTESQFFDLTQFGKIESDQPSFWVIKDDLIRFNQKCINSTKSKLVTVKFNCKSPSELELIFEDPNSGVDKLDSIIDVINGTGSFKYHPEVMNRLLRSIPATQCFFYPGKNKYYITDDNKSFVSLIMGVI